MKAAIVRELGASPVYGEFEEPMPKEGEVRVSVTASALTNLTRGRASGAHYSSAAKLPFIPGIDGVGRLDNGQRVYFIMPRSPFGAMGERTVVDADRSVPVPDEMGRRAGNSYPLAQPEQSNTAMDRVTYGHRRLFLCLIVP
jgi:NADPH:quinone reductase-like Zn-dependent oxidoreductase